MRLLSVGPDHVGGSAVGVDAGSRRLRYRRRHGGQHLPLRHLCAHPSRHQAGGFRSEVLSGVMTVTAQSSKVSRRHVLGGALATGFVFAFHLPVGAAKASQLKDPFAPNAYIRIDDSGRVTLVMPQVEMGQGIYTGVATILAEELDANLAQVVLRHAPPDEKLYANPLFGIQATGGSTSVRTFWTPLRKAGATTRAMLIKAAADQWQVAPATCSAAKGIVIHNETGRQLGYGELVETASKLSPPSDVPLKDPKDFVLIGRPVNRLDTPDKVNGKVIYGIDVMMPGMKFATLAQCPVLGGKVANVEDQAARKIAGVRQIIVLDDLVAVVGDHMWAAKRGLEALEVTWDEGKNANVSSKDIWGHLRAASECDGVVVKSVGDVATVLNFGES